MYYTFTNFTFYENYIFVLNTIFMQTVIGMTTIERFSFICNYLRYVDG